MYKYNKCFKFFLHPTSLPKKKTKKTNFQVFFPKNGCGIANSADPDQTALEQSDLGLHCLLRYFCTKTLDYL